ncbi:MAG: hypothetical protein JXJ20_01715 [Anaerolineae bacterium]|nr:hypothetical protein [Anaerolineae bacterium]
MTGERERLQRARELILQKQFDAARTILQDMPGNPTAHKWLTRLDEIAPQPPRQTQAPEPGSPIRPLRSISSTPPYRSTPTGQPIEVEKVIGGLKYLISGTVAILSILMLVGFFAFSWVDMGNLFNLGNMMEALGQDDDGKLELTAMEIWTGSNNGDKISLKYEELLADKVEGGLANVRLLDRFLIVIPLGAVVLLWLVWNYASDAMPPLYALSAMTIIALALLVFPPLWEQISEQNWKDSMKAEMGLNGEYGDELDDEFTAMFEGLFGMFGFDLTDMYSTGEQTLLGGIAFAVCLLGLVLEFAFVSGAAQHPPADPGQF